MPTMRPGMIMPPRTKPDPSQGSRRPCRMNRPDATVIAASLTLDEAAALAFLHP